MYLHIKAMGTFQQAILQPEENYVPRQDEAELGMLGLLQRGSTCNLRQFLFPKRFLWNGLSTKQSTQKVHHAVFRRFALLSFQEDVMLKTKGLEARRGLWSLWRHLKLLKNNNFSPECCPAKLKAALAIRKPQLDSLLKISLRFLGTLILFFSFRVWTLTHSLEPLNEAYQIIQAGYQLWLVFTFFSGWPISNYNTKSISAMFCHQTLYTNFIHSSVPWYPCYGWNLFFHLPTQCDKIIHWIYCKQK